MKIIITSLIIGVLFVYSEAGLYKVKSPINEKGRHKRSVTADIEIDSAALSGIEITSKYSTDSVKITCEVAGENPSYEWTAQNGELLDNEVAEGNVLSIHQVTKKNDRMFCCKASNTAESLEKCERLPPRLLTSSPLEHTINSSAEMFCEVIGTDLDFDIKWKRADGLPLPDNAIVNGGLLEIPKLARTDTGIYVCVGSLNGKTEAFHPRLSLKVLSPPEIVDVRITGLDDDSNQDVTIQCITQPDETVTYEWKAHTEKHADIRENEKADGNSLSIKIFRKDNEGTFCCVATNALGTGEKCVTIEPLVLEVYPEGSDEVMSGESVTLECRESTGYSNIKTHWAREDGHPFASNVIESTNGSLTVRNITIEDEGRYNCSATKGVLSASITTEIEVKTLPVVKIISSNGRNIIAKLGDEVKLTCNADGHPQPNLQWKKFSTETNSYEAVGVVTLKSTVYEIKSLSGNETGLYLCLAENSAGSSNKTVQVAIKEPVLEVYPTVSHAIMSGNSITLECRESVGYSSMKFSWSRKDNSSFAPNVVQSANGFLMITNITINEEGRYKCSATNGEAFASATAEIKVETLPVVEIIPSYDGNIIAKLGDEVKLTCNADGHPQPSVQWQKFSPETELYQTVKSVTTKSAVYEIMSLSENETGLYQCLVTNSAGFTHKTVQIIIKPLVLKVYPNVSLEVVAGKSVVLECRESAGYLDVEIHWEREDGRLFAPNVVQSAPGYLTITNITTEEKGRYKCSATKGVLSASASTEIKVKSPPVSAIHIEFEYSVFERLAMTCKATGEKLSYHWTGSNGDLLHNEIAEANVLSIKGVTRENDRSFCCEASNAAGSLMKCLQLPTILLINRELTSRVDSTAQLHCSVIGENSSQVRLIWQRADGSSVTKHAMQHVSFFTFAKVAESDTGDYFCVGSLPDGTVVAREKTSLKVIPALPWWCSIVSCD